MTGSVLFHVQYLLGIGHLQRSLRIADALASDGIAVTLVSGGTPVDLPRHPALRFVQLPPIRALDARFALVGQAGQPIDDTLRECRRAALLAVFAAARPDAVIIEGFPFARRAFRFELDPLIAAARVAQPRPRVVCSLRDIVGGRNTPERHREIVARVQNDFDAVLVHGDPAVIPLDASFAAAPEIAERLIYTGYVAPAEKAPVGRYADDGTHEVVVSAGGGAAGKALLDAALAARRSGCLAEMRWLLLTGTHLPEADFAMLRDAAPTGVAVERFHPGLVHLLRTCRVSVSQAGYNTVLDILAAGARAVLVPFAAERETEQLLRAERLTELGAVEMVRENELTPESLAAAIERAVAREPATIAVACDGAVRSARALAAMMSDAAALPADALAAARREGIIGG